MTDQTDLPTEASQGAATDEGPPSNAPAPRHWSPEPRRRIVAVGVAVLALLAIVILLRAWQLPPFASSILSTENAYVRGRTTIIAPQVSGYVTAVLVQDYEDVRKGQVLAQIDDRIYRARVAAAEGNLSAARAARSNSEQARAARAAALKSQVAGTAGARAQLARATADLARIDDLVSDGSVSRRERDQAVAALRVAQSGLQQSLASSEIARQDIRSVAVAAAGLDAQVDVAQAQLRLAQIDLANTVIRAPEAGRVGEIGVRLGQYVTNGTQLLALVPAPRWIIAHFKEAQTAAVRPGQHATFTVDALAGAELAGTVQSLAPATGSEFSVLRPDNATGNFVKVPQRIGVRVLVDPGQRDAARLRPGMSVVMRIDTRPRP